MIDFKKKMNVSVNFFLRGKEGASQDKPCVIYATIDVDGKKCCPFSTKLKVPVKYWMTNGNAKAKIKPSTSEKIVSESYSLAEKVNQHLISLQQFAHEAAGILTAMDLAVSPEAIKELILNPKPLKAPVRYLEVVDNLRISLTSKQRAGSTMLTYRTRRNNIAEFLLEKGYNNLMIDGFRFRHFEELQVWMFDQKDSNGVPRWSKNTINKHLTLVNQVLNYAVNQEYIRSNPIGALNLEYDETKPPEYLTADDRQRIVDCKLTSLEKERDVAVFLTFTGLSYTDYLSLSDEHLFRLPSGEWFIKKSRDKSDVYSIIPLLSQAHDLITKYKGIRGLPRPDISDYNKVLKILGEVCQAPFSLSTSTFRETFSSMMENEFMVPDRLLMFMMGHTNPRQLRNYSRVMPARILYELNKNDIKIPFNLEVFQDLVKAS